MSWAKQCTLWLAPWWSHWAIMLRKMSRRCPSFVRMVISWLEVSWPRKASCSCESTESANSVCTKCCMKSLPTASSREYPVSHSAFLFQPVMVPCESTLMIGTLMARKSLCHSQPWSSSQSLLPLETWRLLVGSCPISACAAASRLATGGAPPSSSAVHWVAASRRMVCVGLLSCSGVHCTSTSSLVLCEPKSSTVLWVLTAAANSRSSRTSVQSVFSSGLPAAPSA
mmetsp:Transcript_97063/g.274941  ORF Transcript_97063/g.274941 Transcript_97063/m.274941 type:complete len:227 (+) Transcript_97063:205-885(+)